MLWVVDLNRQSLDRVVPDIAVGRSGADVRGRRLADDHREVRAPPATSCSQRPGGDELRNRIDSMPNEEYQRLLRARRRRSCASGCRAARPASSRKLVGELDDGELRAAVRDLGGHDPAKLIDAYAADGHDRPTVVFAYTIKALVAADEGHPANHSALLTATSWRSWPATLGADADDPWAAFDPSSPEARAVRRGGGRARRATSRAGRSPGRAARSSGARTGASASTQQAFGRFFFDLVREAPEVAERMVTVSPDVASLHQPRRLDQQGRHLVGGRPARLVRRRPRHARALARVDHGQHIELGIAEANLVGLLGELGATWRRDGQPLLPIGTIYDPFVSRALEPWSFGMYAGGQSILVGTPRGVTLAPEGGAHQSIITPVGRARAARLRRLGAGLRAGPRVDAAARARPARPA